MKILYIIYASRDGRGGHYHSLYETAKSVSKYENIKVLSIGINPSPVLDKLGENYLHLQVNSLFLGIKDLLGIVKKEKPDVIHTFDNPSFFFGRIASLLTKTPILHTKCGGGNPGKYFPYCKDIVLYSFENMKYFKENKKFKQSNLHMIPNRVNINKSDQDLIRISKIKKFLSKDDVSILRISRISSVYEKSIKQAINLTLKLVEDGHKIKLFIIGVVQQEDIYNELLKYQSDNIIFLVENEYTVKASALIDFADIVLGTGRSFMEAALLGKTMLVPCSNLDFPILVTSENINSFFSMNFSPRIFSDMTNEESYNEIENVVFNNNFKGNDLLGFSKDNFSSDLIYEKHLMVYRKSAPEKLRFIDFLLHLYAIRGVFNFF